MSKSNKFALEEAANKTQPSLSKKTGGKEMSGEKKPKAKLAGVKALQKHSKKVAFQPAVQGAYSLQTLSLSLLTDHPLPLAGNNTGLSAQAAAAQKTERAKYLEVLLKGCVISQSCGKLVEA